MVELYYQVNRKDEHVDLTLVFLSNGLPTNFQVNLIINPNQADWVDELRKIQ